MAGRSLRISAHDVSGAVPSGILVQAWLVDVDGVVVGDGAVPATAVSSLAEAAPIGLQVRSGNGSVSFQNRRFSELASGCELVDERIGLALEREDEAVEDLEVGTRWRSGSCTAPATRSGSS